MAERELLLSVAESETERQWNRLEDSLGTRWSIDELTREQKQDSIVPKFVRLPLVPMLAAEAFKHVSDEYRKKLANSKRADPNTIEVGSLSVEEAKAFFKKLTAAPRE